MLSVLCCTRVVLRHVMLRCPAASLGPQNWARWGYGCAIGVALFGSYGICEYVYNRKHGPPDSGTAQEAFDEDWCKGEEGVGAAATVKSAGSKDIETGSTASQVRFDACVRE